MCYSWVIQVLSRLLGNWLLLRCELVGKISTNNHPSQLRFPRHHSYFPAGYSLNLDSLSSAPAFCAYCSLCVKCSSCREPDGTSLSTFSYNQEVFPSHLYKNGTQSTSWYYLVSFCREFPCDSVCLVSPSVLSQPPECKLHPGRDFLS